VSAYTNSITNFVILTYNLYHELYIIQGDYSFQRSNYRVCLNLPTLSSTLLSKCTKSITNSISYRAIGAFREAIIGCAVPHAGAGHGLTVDTHLIGALSSKEVCVCGVCLCVLCVCVCVYVYVCVCVLIYRLQCVKIYIACWLTRI